MDKDLEFIESEQNYWGKIYTDIMFAISEVSPFVEEKKLKIRKYYVKKDVLKEYNKLLETAKSTNSKKSFFSLFKNNSSVDLIKDFKRKNLDDFNELEKCSSCECLNCSFNCNFKSCSSCRKGSHITFCDKDKVNARIFENFTLDLVNNDTKITSKYKVLAVIENCELHKQYILLENVKNNNDKLILYYYPGLKDDDFGEITDIDEFNFVAEIYQSL